ncbi:MAG TPA: HAD family phosphatase [Terriglobales bacterium]|nr:HAD family phosphatase [Terriglobales bacterium]
MLDPKHTPLDIKAVIFDYGQVLCLEPTPEAVEQMSGFFHLTPDQFRPLYDSSRLAYDRGDFTPTAYWFWLAEQAGVVLAPAQIEALRKRDIEMWSRFNQPMIEWMAALQSRGLKTAILSNMPAEMAAHVRRHFAWMAHISCPIFSSELRLVKPDPAIYQHCLECLEVAPVQALFIDDREVNVEGAKKLGIHALRFDSVTQLHSDLKALDFTPLPELEDSDALTEIPAGQSARD